MSKAEVPSADLSVLEGGPGGDEPSVLGEKAPIVLSGIVDLDSRLRSAEELTKRIAVSPENNALKAEGALDSAWSIHQERRSQEHDALMQLQGLLHIEMGPAGYSRMCSEGLIDKPTRNILNRLDIDIRTLENHRGGKRFSQKAEDMLDELRGEQDRCSAELRQSVLEYVREALGRDGLSKEQNEKYAKESEELDRVLTELKESPGVLDLLNEWGEDAQRQYHANLEAQRKEAFRAKAEERDAQRAVLKKLEKAVVESGTAQLHAFERLFALAGADTPLGTIVRLSREPRTGYEGNRTDRELAAVRDMLVNSIVDGEGAMRVASPAEVVPWERRKHGREYLDAIIALRSRDALALIKKHQTTVRTLAALHAKSPEEYQAALDFLSPHEQRAILVVQDAIQILHDDEMLRRLCGNKRDRKHGKTGRNIPRGAFWRAFDTRAQNDASGETVRRKESRRAEKKRAEDRALLEKKIIASPYGFSIRGEGVLLLEPVFFEKSRRHGWRVAEALGSRKLQHELFIARTSGNTYVRDLSNAPRWLALAARDKGII
ncbi:hypothetical protein HY732_04535 [Candidatus Uhrbacteria bacterium]|nr:hypothetical protein [Candidatus Uhrbacteria bacterium]